VQHIGGNMLHVFARKEHEYSDISDVYFANLLS